MKTLSKIYANQWEKKLSMQNAFESSYVHEAVSVPSLRDGTVSSCLGPLNPQFLHLFVGVKISDAGNWSARNFQAWWWFPKSFVSVLGCVSKVLGIWYPIFWSGWCRLPHSLLNFLLLSYGTPIGFQKSLGHSPKHNSNLPFYCSLHVTSPRNKKTFIIAQHAGTVVCNGRGRDVFSWHTSIGYSYVYLDGCIQRHVYTTYGEYIL